MVDPSALDLGPVVPDLLANDDGRLRVMPLVPSGPRACPQLHTLRRLAVADLFPRTAIRSSDDAKCVQSGLYLYFSALDESHTISQGVGTQSGSFWHGIMHRQEGDWSNAKYWFRRTGGHPVFEALEQCLGGPWDPMAFVDRCQAASLGRGPQDTVLDRQMLEWRLLMEHCYRKAVGR